VEEGEEGEILQLLVAGQFLDFKIYRQMTVDRMNVEGRKRSC
jgi:hypothetical protein